MAVEQNNLRHLRPGDLPGTTQTQQMLGVFTFSGVPDSGLAGKERLKPFALQVFQQRDGGDVSVSVTAGFVAVFTEHAGDHLHQFLMG